jgi:HPt (histidine-containing phosphotransfer) domain-containing protein
MQAPVNQAQFQELRELLDDEFDSLIQSYLTDSQLRMQRVMTAFDQNDNTLGYESIHSLKGASANLGASRLAELCLKLQMECKAGRIRNADVLIQSIAEEVARVNAYLQTQMN